MARSIEITLTRPIVLPLLPLMREIADTVTRRGPPDASPAQARRFPTSLVEVRRLLALFERDFENTGVITISDEESSGILRACALLRLQLRAGSLAAISDSVMETSLDAQNYTGKERDAVTCFLFLATLQLVLLENIPLREPGPASRWLDRIRRGFHGRQLAAQPVIAPPDSWQVIVLNDPVNLMHYVTFVFRKVLGLPPDVAQQRMFEVHEQKRTILLTGPRPVAESYVSALQSWHLNAVAAQTAT